MAEGCIAYTAEGASKPLGIIMQKNVLLRHREIPDINELNVYQGHGGFEAFKNVATSKEPGEVTDIIKTSCFRGRGGGHRHRLVSNGPLWTIKTGPIMWLLTRTNLSRERLKIAR